MFGIEFDINPSKKTTRINPLKTAMERKEMIKRVNPLQAAMRKKQAMEAAKATVETTKEVAAEVINSDSDILELQKHRYCGIKPGTKQPDCKWTTQSVGWEQAQTKSDLAIVIPDDYIVVDIDDEQEGKALLRLVESNSQEYDTVISCVMRTDHGYHFWFKKPSQSLDSLGIKHTSKVKTLLTLSVDYRVGGKGYMVIRRDGKDRQWVHGSWADLVNVAIIPNILYPIAPTDDRHKALYQAKASKYGYQVLPDGRMGSYLGLPEGQRTAALLSYYGYLKTFYADIPARDIKDCQMIIYNVNRYLCEEPIPDSELFAEILNNTARVAVTGNNGDNSGNDTTREQDNDNNGGRDIISLSLHGHTSNLNQEDTISVNSTTNTVDTSTTTPTRVRSTNNNNNSYEDMAQDIIDTYNLIYHSNNYYVYNNGVYEALNRNPKDSEILLERMVMAQYPGLLAKHKKEIIRNIRSMTIVTNSDDNGNLLALNNGVYNTDTHTFVGWTDIEMGRYHFFKRIPITYQTLIPVNQTITDFEVYRSSLFSDDTAEEYKKILDQILGYTFYRQLTAQKIFFFYGPGGTGKSTYANFMARLLGKDNTRHKTLNMLLDGKYATSDLKHVMLNVGDETITAKSLTSVDLLKTLAVDGYTETEAKYQAAETVRLYAKHIFCTNERPLTQDKAFWDRVVVIPFRQVFRGTSNNIPDDKLQVMMDSEDVKSYMFAMAMQGLKELQANNWQFSITAEMQAAKDDFVPASNNPIEVWLQDANINEDTISDYDAPDIPNMYKQWCAQHNYRYCGRNKLINYLKEIYPITIKRRRRNGHTVTYFKVDVEIDD